MALLGNKKPMAKPGEVVVEPPPPKPDDDPPPPPSGGPDPLPPGALVIATKPPAQIALVMSVDGGLNGQCWRAGQTVVMDPEAADLYLAKGYATRVK